MIKFEDLKIGEMFKIAGLDKILIKVSERWEELFNPTNCEDSVGQAAGWVNDFQEVEKL